MKVNLLVSRQEEFHAGTLDLQTDRQRAAFIKRAAEEPARQGRGHPQGRGPRLPQRLQAEQIRKALEPASPSQAQRRRARRSDGAARRALIDRFSATSTVAAWWARDNKLVGYLQDAGWTDDCAARQRSRRLPAPAVLDPAYAFRPI